MRKLILLLVISVLALSLVSAFWPFTGYDIAETDSIDTATDNVQQANTVTCIDTDGGVSSSIAGTVINILKGKFLYDSCSGSSVYFYDSDGKKVRGKSRLIELYCTPEDVEKTTFTSETLGEGACVKDGKSAKWVLKNQVCKELQAGNGVIDQNGKVYKNRCNENKFVTYSCGSDGTVETVERDCTTSDGFGKCTANGCTGVCDDSDSEDDKNVAGIVTFNGVEYKDTCNSANTGVLQYKCVKGIVKKVGDGSVSCGKNRECVLGENGAGYCKDKYAGAETIETLNRRILALQALITSLTERIDALENPSQNPGTSEGVEIVG